MYAECLNIHIFSRGNSEVYDKLSMRKNFTEYAYGYAGIICIWYIWHTNGTISFMMIYAEYLENEVLAEDKWYQLYVKLEK